MYLEIVFAFGFGVLLAALDDGAPPARRAAVRRAGRDRRSDHPDLHARRPDHDGRQPVARRRARRLRPQRRCRRPRLLAGLAVVIVLLFAGSRSAESLWLRLTSEGQETWYRAAIVAPQTLELATGRHRERAGHRDQHRPAAVGLARHAADAALLSLARARRRSRSSPSKASGRRSPRRSCRTRPSRSRCRCARRAGPASTASSGTSCRRACSGSAPSLARCGRCRVSSSPGPSSDRRRCARRRRRVRRSGPDGWCCGAPRRGCSRRTRRRRRSRQFPAGLRHYAGLARDRRADAQQQHVSRGAGRRRPARRRGICVAAVASAACAIGDRQADAAVAGGARRSAWPPRVLAIAVHASVDSFLSFAPTYVLFSLTLGCAAACARGLETSPDAHRV